MDRSHPSASGTALAYGIATHGLFVGLLVFAAGFVASGRPLWQALAEFASALGAILALALGSPPSPMARIGKQRLFVPRGRLMLNRCSS